MACVGGARGRDRSDRDRKGTGMRTGATGGDRDRSGAGGGEWSRATVSVFGFLVFAAVVTVFAAAVIVVAVVAAAVAAVAFWNRATVHV